MMIIRYILSCWSVFYSMFGSFLFVFQAREITQLAVSGTVCRMFVCHFVQGRVWIWPWITCRVSSGCLSSRPVFKREEVSYSLKIRINSFFFCNLKKNTFLEYMNLFSFYSWKSYFYVNFIKNWNSNDWYKQRYVKYNSFYNFLFA